MLVKKAWNRVNLYASMGHYIVPKLIFQLKHLYFTLRLLETSFSVTLLLLKITLGREG